MDAEGVPVGDDVGEGVGVLDGVEVGLAVGVLVGGDVGEAVGVFVGVVSGVAVGVPVGVPVGVEVGVAVGVVAGVTVGVAVGVGATPLDPHFVPSATYPPVASQMPMSSMIDAMPSGVSWWTIPVTSLNASVELRAPVPTPPVPQSPLAFVSTYQAQSEPVPSLSNSILML
jgi:hypothetical protein